MFREYDDIGLWSTILIESQWNLNVHHIVELEDDWEHINRITVEFK